MECLNHRLVELQALVTLLGSKSSPEVIDEAINAAYGLPALDMCADVEALSQAMPPPADPDQRLQLAILQEQLANAKALLLAGSHKLALTQAEELARKGRELDYPPFSAEAGYLLGVLEEKAGQSERAERTLLAAARSSARAGDDPLSARIWTALIQTVGHTKARFQEATWIGQMADAAVLRAGDKPLLRARLDSNLGSAAWAASNTTEAYVKHVAALKVLREELGDTHPEVVLSLKNISATLYRRGRFQEAADRSQEALELGIAALGANHPAVALSHMNLGVSLVPVGDYDKAREHYRQALTIAEKTYGASHEIAGYVHANLGELGWLQGKPEKARREYQHAYDILEPSYGREHPMMTYPLTGLGQAHVGLGQAEPAIAALTQAKATREEAKAEPAERALTQFYLQRAQWLRGERDPAVLAQARAAFEVYKNDPYHLEAEVVLMQEWLASLATEPPMPGGL